MDIAESAEIHSGDAQWGEESVEFSAEGTVMSREGEGTVEGYRNF